MTPRRPTRFALSLFATCCVMTVLAWGRPVAAAPDAARGAYLAQIAGCVGCHTPDRSKKADGLLSGGRLFGSGPTAIVAPNITSDRATGLGGWTDRQIADAIRLGRTPDGRRLRPPMPQTAFRALRDDDVDALVAYLRRVPSVTNAVAVSRAPPVKSEPGVVAPAASSTGDPLAAGRYLANAVTHCTECHTPGPASALDYSRLDQGGRSFHTAAGNVVAPAITPDGLAAFSDAALARIITTGVRPDGTMLKGPMPVAAYAHLSAEDLGALIGYLRAEP